MKYIMLEDIEGRKIPIIFPDHIVHADMAKLACNLIARQQKAIVQPIAAGFISIGTDIMTFGESETLKLKSRTADAAYIVAGEAGQYMPEIMVSGLLARIKARAPK